MRYSPTNIYLVEFLNGDNPEYYNKLKSIYNHHTRMDIGCCLGHLYDCHISPSNPYQNKKVRIRLIELKK
ncbi:hypothetical protein [Emticicia sp. BO119]|uniref:hypothetical protein n=1 Tax=Emticicia sp. BO119 TaxID=2757768 RepID=UPI0015EFE2FC|nr:hypothetical protein [Emticicia sp. BO119]MBA4852070.1 hypothetical protein [Emticicia sp. BO119]